MGVVSLSFCFNPLSFFFNVVSLLFRAKQSLVRCSFSWRPLEKTITPAAEQCPGPWHSCRRSSRGWPADACPRPATEPPWQGSSTASGRPFTPTLISQPQRYGDLRVGRKRSHAWRDCGAEMGTGLELPPPRAAAWLGQRSAADPSWHCLLLHVDKA